MINHHSAYYSLAVSEWPDGKVCTYYGHIDNATHRLISESLGEYMQDRNQPWTPEELMELTLRAWLDRRAARRHADATRENAQPPLPWEEGPVT